MTPSDLVLRRLYQQCISHPRFKNPEDVVTWLGAVQAQDYLGALWAVGLRLPNGVETDIEQALANRKIIRTWPMRGTLHFVPSVDATWMLELMTPRSIAKNARRLKKEFNLDEKIFARCRRILIKALQGGNRLSRNAMYETLEAAHINAAGQRGLHILWRLAQEGLICFGPREGRQQTFVLLDEWIPKRRTLSRDEALAELTRRYFTGHGPATVEDLIWWSGLASLDAKAGLDMVKSNLVYEKINDHVYWMSPAALTSPPKTSSKVYLLPNFDEFMIGYSDRSASLDLQRTDQLVDHGHGIFSAIIVIRGKILGTWRRSFIKNKVCLEAKAFDSFSKGQCEALRAAAGRYGKFLGMEVVVMTR